jgi:hypothetical protein
MIEASEALVSNKENLHAIVPQLDGRTIDIKLHGVMRGSKGI